MNLAREKVITKINTEIEACVQNPVGTFHPVFSAIFFLRVSSRNPAVLLNVSYVLVLLSKVLLKTPGCVGLCIYNSIGITLHHGFCSPKVPRFTNIYVPGQLSTL